MLIAVEEKSGSYSDYSGNEYRDEAEVDYSILEAVGLIRRVETNFFSVADWTIAVSYYYLTDLGYHFAVACGLVASGKDKDETPSSGRL